MTANIAIGLLTSMLGGAFVWLWERYKRLRALRGRCGFFGLEPGGTCLIVMGSKHDARGSTPHRDVLAMIEVATLASDVGCEVSVVAGEEFRGSNGDRTEFCIGGPIGGANVRTGGHLAAHLPGVRIRPFSSRRDSLAFEVGGERYLYDRGNQEYALVAKFTPEESARPVVVVCGQSPTANHAAMHLLKREHRELARSLASVDRFCLVVRVSDIATYGFHRAALERDVTTAAFASG